ncbi:hypothetical protein PHET_08469 [Paragonimus heterotremus]|uniref:Uncharacterized protein n=1 Tax=Paragonimus heterotremus TaxID=100268 RepID=A0A8J4TC84_9TREM|nr:hypothetical protein PHET_08469 [Paragonimus heterotremus]
MLKSACERAVAGTSYLGITLSPSVFTLPQSWSASVTDNQR